MITERAPHMVAAISENLKSLKGGLVTIDIDAVTQATYMMAIQRASRQLGKAISKEQLRTYWEMAEIGRAHGMSEAEAMGFAIGVWNNHDVYKYSPEMPGIRVLLETFTTIQIPYVFVSSRPVEFEGVTKEWFAEKFPWIDEESIILGRKDSQTGGEFKSGILKFLGSRLHIEDAPEEAVTIADRLNIPVILVPQPWNVAEEITNPRIKKLASIDDSSGVWPVMRFLVSKEAKAFLSSVAQS